MGIRNEFRTLYRKVAEFQTLLLFALEEDVCEREARRGQPKTVESVREYRRGSEILIVPEMIEQRVVRPVVTTSIVQIQKSGACANGYHVRQVLIPQHRIEGDDQRRHKDNARHNDDAVDLEISREINRRMTSHKLNQHCEYANYGNQ